MTTSLAIAMFLALGYGSWLVHVFEEVIWLSFKVQAEHGILKLRTLLTLKCKLTSSVLPVCFLSISAGAYFLFHITAFLVT